MRALQNNGLTQVMESSGRGSFASVDFELDVAVASDKL